LKTWRRPLFLFGASTLTGCALVVGIDDHYLAPMFEGGVGADADAASGGADASADGGSCAPSKGGTLAGVTLDAVGPSDGGAGGAGIASPLTWSHTTSGENRAIFVGVAAGYPLNAPVAITVEYDGTPLRQVGMRASNNANIGQANLWVLADPPLGAHLVKVSFSGSPLDITAGSISFAGVDRSTPYRNANSAAGVSGSPQLTVTSAPGNMVVSVLASGCDIGSSAQSLGWLKNVNCGSGGGNGAQSTANGASSVSLAYSTKGDVWALVGADINAASCSSE
jgi:hypothetical protein